MTASERNAEQLEAATANRGMNSIAAAVLKLLAAALGDNADGDGDLQLGSTIRELPAARFFAERWLEEFDDHHADEVERLAAEWAAFTNWTAETGWSPARRNVNQLLAAAAAFERLGTYEAWEGSEFASAAGVAFGAFYEVAGGHLEKESRGRPRGAGKSFEPFNLPELVDTEANAVMTKPLASASSLNPCPVCRSGKDRCSIGDVRVWCRSRTLPHGPDAAPGWEYKGEKDGAHAYKPAGGNHALAPVR